MRKKVVDDAKAAAKRLLERIALMERAAGTYDYSERKNDPYYNSGQYTAAVRRASMDLTRTLAALRRG
jgi:hypothetical protein